MEQGNVNILEGGGVSDLGQIFSFKQLALRNIQRMCEDEPDVILTTTGASDLQTAISNLENNQILEIATNATYDPITLYSGKILRIRAKAGYNPKITGSRCIRLMNGAQDIVISGLTIENADNTGGNNNYTGTAITFGEHQAIVDNIIFHNITIKNTTAGSSVMLSYHWSVGGDLYYNPPQLTELSTRVAFIGCNIYKGCLDGNEGACISVRGLNNSILLNNYIDNDNDAGRGIQMQGCLCCLVEENKIYNIGGTNAEGIKIDQIGTSPFIQTSYFIKNFVQNAIEGIDIDDNVSALVMNNICRNCSNEGISLDDSSQGIFLNNICFDNVDGIRFELGSLGYLANNNCFNNSNNNYRMDNGYSPDASNKSISDIYFSSPTKVKFTPEGGLAIKLTNKSGANSIKGYLVKTSSTVANAVTLLLIDDICSIGVFYESGIPDGQECWIVVSGIADVYFSASTTIGLWARGNLTGDTGATNGMAYAKSVSVPPITAAEHFGEIGHVIETRVGAGLAKIVMHLN